MRAGVLCLGGFVGFLASTPIRAQTSGGASGFVAGRVGVNVQAVPDGVSGAALGTGTSAGAFVASKWALEFEGWFPGEVEDPGVRNWVLLFSGSAMRFFDDERRGPYMLFGMTAARIEFGSSRRRNVLLRGGVQLGIGSAVRLSERTMVAPELRVNVIDGTAFLIRPNIAFLYALP